MSFHRVASIETLTDHHVRARLGDAAHRPRRLSFNPLPQPWDPSQPELGKATSVHDYAPSSPGAGNDAAPPVFVETDAVGAFEVPVWKRIGKPHVRPRC